MPKVSTLLGNRSQATGGLSFLGARLCDWLLALGQNVLCVDSLFAGQKRNISHLTCNPLFEFTCYDVTFPLFVEVDQIRSLACPASPYGQLEKGAVT